MIVTNTVTSSAYPGSGVKVTLDPTNTADMDFLSWSYPGMILTSDASGDKGVIDTVDRAGYSFIVMPVQPNLTFMGSEPYKLKPADTISANENKIGNLIWKLSEESTTLFDDGGTVPYITSSSAWAANTTGAYTHFNNDPVTYPVKLYNKYAVLRGLNTMINGWRVPNLNDVLDLLKATNPTYTTYPTNNANLPYNGQNLRSIALGGTNFKEFNAVNTGIRSGNGSFSGLAPVYHVIPILGSLPPWQANNSFYINSGRTFYFNLQLGSTAYSSSLFLGTGYGLRLCRDIQENVVITK